MGHLEVLRCLEEADVRVKDVQAGGVALLAVAAEHLHPYADAQHGLAQAADHVHKAAFAEVGHCLRGVAYAGQQDLVRRNYGGGIVGNRIFRPKPGEGVLH